MANHHVKSLLRLITFRNVKMVFLLSPWVRAKSVSLSKKALLLILIFPIGDLPDWDIPIALVV